MAAAALVALVFAWNLPRQVAAPTAISIAVDINPSLKLRLNPAAPGQPGDRQRRRQLRRQQRR